VHAEMRAGRSGIRLRPDGRRRVESDCGLRKPALRDTNLSAGPYWSGTGVTLYQGDACAVLRRLPTGSVDCVVTSPPYWGLRDYRVAGQYGTEATVDGYIASLARVFDELARVLAPTGTVWLNLADTFGGSWGNYVAPGSTAATAARRAGWRQGAHRPPQARHRAKDLVGVPWRVALALAERGWVLRNAVVWVKPNARPESVRDRLSQRYEWVFLFARSADHWFAPLSDADGDVWRIASPRAATKHVAAGSVELARRCIASGARPGGVVLDPFSGSGTTGVAARMLGHDYIGIDLDPYCHEIAARRLADLRAES
jgi:DNA modification methylase